MLVFAKVLEFQETYDMHKGVTKSQVGSDSVHEVEDVSLAGLVLELNMAIVKVFLDTPLCLCLSGIW